MFSLCLLALVFVSCTETQEYTVEHRGALRNIMMSGDLSAQADLSTMAGTPHLYALGALEDLKGEVLILDGKPYIATADDGGLRLSHSFQHSAALLVYCEIGSWSTLDVPGEVRSYKEFEEFVAQVASENGVDTSKPFPFLLEGRVGSADWHVVNWKEGDTDHSHLRHIESGPNGNLRDREVEILGFYSDSHHAVFTHHTTNMHLHLITRDRKVAGHLDDLILGEGMRLRLPNPK